MFRDRREAGERLARAVAERAGPRPRVLALPRGGVPVARPVADALGVPLDIVVARKIPAPGSPETAIGATTAEGPALFDQRALDLLGIPEGRLAEMVGAQQAEARRRLLAYRGEDPEPEVTGYDVVVVDDGLATGMSARAALTSVLTRRPASLTLAVPVGAPEAVRALSGVCDRVVCLETPPDFGAVSLWYARFPQVTDDEVRGLLVRLPRGPGEPGGPGSHGSGGPGDGPPGRP
ncbi:MULTISPECIES: phosphoribosyltransferase [Nocardiopsis]|uniref:Phosphoribosyltransferase n=1 Tax=Nocardiopsis dassonvillei (strain ATCC 23218 / DSM 43111 / CIP 107115 / JCM 7437 / KCTC 9190 / NBRC 14626 / NCTC 10488 / NRRL B-5397 / IMRU 509) TaxID=446468 RepID=D7B209_NOCDD|nr:phosphoribosyltransferase family protein [Nocardiopsis dassonvillei]ADH66630.1 phosphoribosyltransferase [Nocardiopsis dassonvillei subsp. dassonvillei DSM 43111]APC34939.1 phosphoribosyltransferase [Nocardiopsis dassonvillei]NKY78949.1 phosphoribosyltransferase [Nocardiopsis dassonvillei]VEI92652.1 Phosphoribosyl transferase domain [Nocardiopsis dassonvillei]